MLCAMGNHLLICRLNPPLSSYSSRFAEQVFLRVLFSPSPLFIYEPMKWENDQNSFHYLLMDGICELLSLFPVCSVKGHIFYVGHRNHGTRSVLFTVATVFIQCHFHNIQDRLHHIWSLRISSFTHSCCFVYEVSSSVEGWSFFIPFSDFLQDLLLDFQSTLVRDCEHMLPRTNAKSRWDTEDGNIGWRRQEVGRTHIMNS